MVTDDSVKEKIQADDLTAMYYADAEGKQSDQYPQNSNESWHNIAALSNKSGAITGLMPHPEAYNHYTNHPQ